mmetsp:Transcript_5430/g.12065  ORF Transcript_5430/g.12065 Transcript_5430/m.12065 type:complete len:109 (+) Transcript_5430:31-357(+)
MKLGTEHKCALKKNQGVSVRSIFIAFIKRRKIRQNLTQDRTPAFSRGGADALHASSPAQFRLYQHAAILKSTATSPGEGVTWLLQWSSKTERGVARRRVCVGEPSEAL